MTKQTTKSPKPAKPRKQPPRKAATPPPAQREGKQTRSEMIAASMRAEGGKTAEELAQAIGWQKHSVRGFIAGTLKKRADVEVVTTKVDGVTRYQLRDRASA